MSNNKYTDFVKPKDVKYNSIVDEYRRIKYFVYKKKFDTDSKEILFELLARCLKHMFKIKRELKVGIEFGLNVKNTYTLYKLTTFDQNEKYIVIEWFVDNDEYMLEFKLKKNRIVFHQKIHREKTFFGMADYIGIIIYKKAFKSNMKAFCNYINHLIENGEVEKIRDDLANNKKTQTKKLPSKKSTSENK